MTASTSGEKPTTTTAPHAPSGSGTPPYRDVPVRRAVLVAAGHLLKGLAVLVVVMAYLAGVAVMVTLWERCKEAAVDAAAEESDQ